MTMSNRLAVMRHGRIEQIGAPEEVYERPATEFVAGFLGASNLLDGDLDERGPDQATVRLQDGSVIRIPAENLNGSLDRSVKVGVRPEKIRLMPEREPVAEGWNCVSGTLQVSTYVGVSHQYTVAGPAGRTITVYAQNVGGDWLPRHGDAVRMVWRPEHTFVVTPSAPLADWEEET